MVQRSFKTFITNVQNALKIAAILILNAKTSGTSTSDHSYYLLETGLIEAERKRFQSNI